MRVDQAGPDRFVAETDDQVEEEGSAVEVDTAQRNGIFVINCCQGEKTILVTEWGTPVTRFTCCQLSYAIKTHLRAR